MNNRLSTLIIALAKPGVLFKKFSSIGDEEKVEDHIKNKAKRINKGPYDDRVMIIEHLEDLIDGKDFENIGQYYVGWTPKELRKLISLIDTNYESFTSYLNRIRKEIGMPQIEEELE